MKKKRKGGGGLIPRLITRRVVEKTAGGKHQVNATSRETWRAAGWEPKKIAPPVEIFEARGPRKANLVPGQEADPERPGYRCKGVTHKGWLKIQNGFNLSSLRGRA